MDFDPLWGDSSHVCWDMTEAHRFLHKVLCALCPTQKHYLNDILRGSPWGYNIGIFFIIIMPFHTQSKHFFSSDIKNLIGESANIEICPIVVDFAHNSSSFLNSWYILAYIM